MARIAGLLGGVLLRRRRGEPPYSLHRRVPAGRATDENSTDPVGKLSTPRIINLVTDPQEREDIALPHLHTWTAVHFNRMLGQFKASTEREPTIPAGAPLEFVPGGTGDQAPAG